MLRRYSEYSDAGDNDDGDQQEVYYEKCIRINAKFVIALYFEQIRLLHLLKYDNIEMKLE